MKVGIDIGGSHIAIGLVNNNGEILKKIEKDIEQQENMETDIVNYVDNAISELVKIDNIDYIGIAAPGNPKNSKIYNIVNLKIDELDFSFIEEKYKIKIKSINDAKAAGLAEKKYGSLKDYNDAVFLCLGTGIGGAVFLDNKLLIANKNPGFELGHMVIDRKGDRCNCGKKGCFETYCSMKRWKEKVVNELNEIEKDIKIEDGSNIVELLKKHSDNEKLQELVDEYINNLIVGLSNIIDIFEPEIIALGGSFVYFKDILYDKLLDEMNKRMYVFNKEDLPKIELAKFKNDAGIIGATLI